jgi:hypothetical protein
MFSIFKFKIKKCLVLKVRSCLFLHLTIQKNMACHLTTADFINQQADGPFLDATWKCRVPGCVKVPGEHPAPIVQPGNYLIY